MGHFSSNGAICFKGKHGATRQYAKWISEATGFYLFDLKDKSPDLTFYDTIVLGSAVYVGHYYLKDWIIEHWPKIRDKNIVLFTVSGTAPDHPDIQTYFKANLSDEIRDSIKYVPLQGKLKLQDLNWLMRLMLKWAGRMQKDEEARQRMTQGFDFVEKENIQPVLEAVESFEMKEV